MAAKARPCTWERVREEGEQVIGVSHHLTRSGDQLLAMVLEIDDDQWSSVCGGVEGFGARVDGETKGRAARYNGILFIAEGEECGWLE